MIDRQETIENASDKLLEALLGAAVDGIVVIDEKARILSFSAGAQEMFGFSTEFVIGKNVTVLMPEPYHGEHDGYMDRYLETGQARIIGIGREVKARHSDGTVFPIDLSVGEAPMGDHSLFVGIMRDLRRRTSLENELKSERAHGRQLERSLEHVHRVSTLGEMTAGIAHEINQPLAAIATYADAAQRFTAQDTPQVEKIAYALSSIAQQARRAGDVVQRMRDLAQQTETPRALRNINHVLRDLLVLMETEARDSDAPIKLSLSDDLPAVKIDPVQIQQVVINLVRNGLEAMILRSQAEKGIRIESHAHAEGVEIVVIDHGEGVPLEKVDSIFLPFETSKPSGMGIGLSICSTIVQRHGGQLYCEPNPGGGSRFRFTLPAAEDSAGGNEK
ncbi:MAG: nitrogen regulation protein NR(II) [Gammaproteobacteria bacterium]